MCSIVYYNPRLYDLEPGRCFPNSVFVEGLCSSEILLWWHWLQDNDSQNSELMIIIWSHSRVGSSVWLFIVSLMAPITQHMSPRGCSVNLVNEFIHLQIAFWLDNNAHSFWDLIHYTASSVIVHCAPWDYAMFRGGNKYLLCSVWGNGEFGVEGIKNDALKSC